MITNIINLPIYQLHRLNRLIFQPMANPMCKTITQRHQIALTAIIVHQFIFHRAIIIYQRLHIFWAGVNKRINRLVIIAHRNDAQFLICCN